VILGPTRVRRGFRLAQAWIERAIALRLSALSAADSVASTRSALTAPDRAALSSTIATDRAGLGAIALSVRSEGNVAQLQGAADSIITSYRVLSILLPQVHATVGLDASEAELAKLARTEAEIAAAVTTASALGDSATLQRFYEALVSAVSSARSLFQAAHSAIVALVPSSYPSAAQVFASARRAIVTVRSDITSAEADIYEIAKLLRDRIGTPTIPGAPSTSTAGPGSSVSVPSLPTL
jgi:hypothetical protein